MRWILGLLAMGLLGAVFLPDRVAAATRADGKCAAQEQQVDGAWGEYNRISYGSGVELATSEQVFSYTSNIFKKNITKQEYNERRSSYNSVINDAKIQLKLGESIEESFIVKKYTLLICYLDFMMKQSAIDGGNKAGASSQSTPSSGGMRGADSATGGTVGQNRGKGGNPDWIYDDVDHDNCVSVETQPPKWGTEMAYGHYKLINSCNYPIQVRICVTADRADGTPSPEFEQHKDGLKCPGIGWGMSMLQASAVSKERTWYEYKRLKWEIRACREGWNLIGADGEAYSDDLLGGKYGCRKRRASK